MLTNPKEPTSSASPAVSVPDRSEANWETCAAAQSLKRLQANPRVKYIVIAAPEDACPICQQLSGTYAKDQVPHLPVEACSHPLGCRSYYMPFLDDIYP